MEYLRSFGNGHGPGRTCRRGSLRTAIRGRAEQSTSGEREELRGCLPTDDLQGAVDGVLLRFGTQDPLGLAKQFVVQVDKRLLTAGHPPRRGSRAPGRGRTQAAPAAGPAPRTSTRTASGGAATE